MIIWTDCDREGENIGFEIIDVCKKVKPNIKVYRAKFSEITSSSVMRAINNLEMPNKSLSDAVDVRMELDLRIGKTFSFPQSMNEKKLIYIKNCNILGAAFTRFQSLYLQKKFPDNFKSTVVSYGSCQFPTLGFVVERFKNISQFISEPFWRIEGINFFKYVISFIKIHFKFCNF